MALALSAVIATVVACNSSGSPGADAPGSTSGSPGNTKIIYGQIQGSTNHLPLYVAIGQGFFDKAGLNVSIQTLSGGTTATMAAMKAGAINVMGAGAAEFVEYIGKKVVDGKMFGEVADQVYDIIVAKDIASLQQLKGQPIGISGLNGGDNTYFDAVLEKYGISTRDVTFVTTGSSTNRITALANGAVKAIAVPNDRRAATSAVGTILLKSGESPIRIPGGMYLANSNLLSNHKPLLQKFLAAMGEATAWIRNNQEAAAADCVKAVQTTLADCTAAIEFNLDPRSTSPYHWSATGAMNAEGLEEAIRIMGQLEPELKGLSLDDVADFSIAGSTPSVSH
jgi:ABC-type nitrate/sulfonate/bicarbonate transport system substrate-binding protein